MQGDTPLVFGLHPNAEIGYRTANSNAMFETLVLLQPRTEGNSADTMTPTEIAQAKMGEVMDKIGDIVYDDEDIISAIDDVGPYENVFLQECSAMNELLVEIKRSLRELEMGFNGELTMSESMEKLELALFLGKVPESWAKMAWPSLRGLDLWIADMLNRCTQLTDWTGNPNEPPIVTWLSGLIIPQSFLTAVKQVIAQRQELELDKLVTWTEWTKKSKIDDFETHAKGGAFITGFSMQGARFDIPTQLMSVSKPKEMFCEMPVVNCKAILAEKEETSGIFSCPCYKAENRGPTYVFSAQCRTKAPADQWILAGVALVLDVASY